MQSGIYNIPADQYHASDGISSHGLGSISISPLHYWSWHVNPERPQKKETPAGLLGTAIHTCILEPERFQSEYVQEPQESDYPGVLVSADDYKQACKKYGLKITGSKPELKASLLASGSFQGSFWDDVYGAATYGSKVLSKADWRVCRTISDRVRKNRITQEVFKSGLAEQSMYWKDQETGVLCRARPDWLPTSGGVVDIKSARFASPVGFQRAIMSYKYHIQAAFYLDGLTALGYPTSTFLWAVWEKHVPYASALYWATPEILDAGRQEYRKLIRIYADCLSSDKWPGYSDSIEAMGLPEWYQPEGSTEQEDDWLTEMENQ